MSSTKIIIPVALLAALAAATYFIQSRIAANRVPAPIILKPVPGAKQAQVYYDDALAHGASRRQWPSVVDF
jgi:hypothetical protein